MLFREQDPVVGQSTGDISAQIEQELAEIRQNLAKIKAVVAIASGKGGCGKSTLTVSLATALALKGRKIGILDADLNSPSVASMLGMSRIQIFPVTGGVEPASGPLGLRVMASDLLVDQAQMPISFEQEDYTPPSTNGVEKVEVSESQALRDLCSQTRFGALDILFIDLPTGLDHLQRLTDAVTLSGVLIVTQPSQLALKVTRHIIEWAARTSLPMLGLIENMAGFNCGSCHSVRPLLPQGDTVGLAREFKLPLIGRLAFDERLADSCDRGALFTRENPDVPLAKRIAETAQKLEDILAAQQRQAETANAIPAAISLPQE